MVSGLQVEVIQNLLLDGCTKIKLENENYTGSKWFPILRLENMFDYGTSFDVNPECGKLSTNGFVEDHYAVYEDVLCNFNVDDIVMILEEIKEEGSYYEDT